MTAGEKQVAATKEAQEVLRIVEEHGLGEKKFFGGNNMGLADIAFGWIATLMEILEQAAGVKVLEDNTFPRLKAWIQNFNEIPVIKESLPDRNALLTYYKARRVDSLRNSIIVNTASIGLVCNSTTCVLSFS